MIEELTSYYTVHISFVSDDAQDQLSYWRNLFVILSADNLHTAMVVHVSQSCCCEEVHL